MASAPFFGADRQHRVSFPPSAAVSAATRNLLAPVPAPDAAFGPALAPAPFGEMEGIMNGEPDSGEFDMPDPTGDLESVS